MHVVIKIIAIRKIFSSSFFSTEILQVGFFFFPFLFFNRRHVSVQTEVTLSQLFTRSAKQKRMTKLSIVFRRFHTKCIRWPRSPKSVNSFLIHTPPPAKLDIYIQYVFQCQHTAPKTVKNAFKSCSSTVTRMKSIENLSRILNHSKHNWL